MPKQYKIRYPKPPEKNYESSMMKMVNGWKKSIVDKILPVLEAMKVDYDRSTGRTDVSWQSMMETAMKALTIEFSRSSDQVIGEMPVYGRQVDDWHDQEWKRAVKSVMGIDIVRFEPWQRSFRQSFIDSNTELIKKLEVDTLQGVRRVISDGIQDGKGIRTISQELVAEASLKSLDGSSEIKKTRNRARLIAQDQVGSYNSRLNQQRQQDTGITGYIWDNSNDARVRGNPAGLYPNSKHNHWTREGKFFSWDNPPSDGHAGRPVRCRCIAQPDFSTIGLA